MTVGAAVLGPGGYTGRELMTRLRRHRAVGSITQMSARAEAADASDTGVVPFDPDKLAEEHDVVFSCLPHRVGGAHVARLARTRPELCVIDLSADFRFSDAAVYEEVYGTDHPAPDLCPAACYGLTEHSRHALAKARLVANPGCYPTATLLPLLPLAKEGLISAGTQLVVDAKSGISGAGKSPSDATIYGNVNENCRAYGVPGHRHGPEITAQLGVPRPLVFVPHVVPMFRGMLATIYISHSGATADDVRDVLGQAYESEPFIRMVPGQPGTGDVQGTNECHIAVSSIGTTTVITSAIDNLVKGASGQAVQNMNRALDFEETEGLI